MTDDSMTESEKNKIRLSNITGRIFKNLYSKWDQSFIVITNHNYCNPDLHIFIDGDFCNPNFTGLIEDMTIEHQKSYRDRTNQLLLSMINDPDVLQLSLSKEHIFCELIIYAQNRTEINKISNNGLPSPEWNGMVYDNYNGLELGITDDNGNDWDNIGFHEFKYETLLEYIN